MVLYTITTCSDEDTIAQCHNNIIIENLGQVHRMNFILECMDCNNTMSWLSEGSS